jgi:UDP-N-acetylglucosamine 4,6-dehydratase
LGVIKNEAVYSADLLTRFTRTIEAMHAKANWTKAELVDLFNFMIPDFAHKETGKYLDARM